MNGKDAITYENLNTPPQAPRILPATNSIAVQHSSCNEGRGSRRIVLECWRDLLLRLVVTGKTVDTRLDENETELGVLVLAVGLQVLADGDSLLDQVPQVLRDLWCKTFTQS